MKIVCSNCRCQPQVFQFAHRWLKATSMAVGVATRCAQLMQRFWQSWHAWETTSVNRVACTRAGTPRGRFFIFKMAEFSWRKHPSDLEWCRWWSSFGGCWMKYVVTCVFVEWTSCSCDLYGRAEASRSMFRVVECTCFFDGEDGVPVFVGVRRFHVKYFYSQVERLISVVTKKIETLSVSCKAAMKATMRVTTKWTLRRRSAIILQGRQGESDRQHDSQRSQRGVHVNDVSGERIRGTVFWLGSCKKRTRECHRRPKQVTITRQRRQIPLAKAPSFSLER